MPVGQWDVVKRTLLDQSVEHKIAYLNKLVAFYKEHDEPEKQSKTIEIVPSRKRARDDVVAADDDDTVLRAKCEALEKKTLALEKERDAMQADALRKHEEIAAQAEIAAQEAITAAMLLQQVARSPSAPLPREAA